MVQLLGQLGVFLTPPRRVTAVAGGQWPNSMIVLASRGCSVCRNVPTVCFGTQVLRLGRSPMGSTPRGFLRAAWTLSIPCRCRQSRFRFPSVAEKKVFGFPKICKLAHAFLWDYIYKRLNLGQLLGQLGIFLTRGGTHWHLKEDGPQGEGEALHEKFECI